MGIELYILRPGLTEPGAVEGGSWVSNPSEVTHFLIDCGGRGKKLSNGIIENEYPGYNNKQINIKKISRLEVFTDIILGNAEDDVTALKWEQAMDYAIGMWPSLADKQSVIYRLVKGGAEATGFHIWNGSAFVRYTGMIVTYELSEDKTNNIFVDSITMKWGN